MRMRHILSVVYSILHPLLKHVLSIIFSNISSTLYSQISRLNPILKLLVWTLISHIPSAVSSQISLYILFSITSPESYSQTPSQYPYLKHLLSIPFIKASIYHTLKHLSILKHTPTILSTNISSLSYSQTSICTLFSNTYAISHSQTSPHQPNLKRLVALCTYNPLCMPFSDINYLHTNNYNKQLHI